MSEKTKSKSKEKDKESIKEEKDKKSSKDSKDKDKDKDKEKSSKEKKSSKSKDDESKKNKSIMEDPLSESRLEENLKIEKVLADQPSPPEKYNYESYMNRNNLSSKFNSNLNSNRGMYPNQIQGGNFSGERCDGCFDGEGQCFCVNCEKIFCKMCEDQIHVVPSNRLHERVAITDVYHLKKLCYHHNNPLKFYCESCEEPVCHECQMVGPHNNKLHRISNVFESFRKKFSYVNNLVQKSLISKLDQLTNQIQMIEFHIEEVKNVKNNIERDIRTEYSQMIENLRGEEGKKLAILQYDSAILQKEINKIQDIVNVVTDINMSETPDMIAFLLRYKQLNETVEMSIVRPFKKSIEVSTEDFPRELDERRAKLESFENMKKLLKAKDDIIWNLIQEKKLKDEKELLKLKEKTQNEVAEWAKLSDKYAMELKKYHLICHFCGCYLEENTVNSVCSKNCQDENKGSYSVSLNIPADLMNTKRHFFASPKETPQMGKKDVLNALASKILDQKPASSDTLKNPFENNILNDTKLSAVYKSGSNSGNLRYSDESIKEKVQQDWVLKVASIIQKNHVNFYQVLNDFDLDNDGYIGPNDLRLAFVKLQINLSNSDLDNMLRYFDISHMDRISIKEFSKNFLTNMNE